MDNKLWQAILEFKLDHPNEEYGFSTRLAFENNWTLHFTQTAILEYKKFMYLAGTSNEMVSPSEIVDIVWHQHLIFTNSYAELGQLLNKKIEHIPSTHNKSEKEKFAKAKLRTKELYESNFGKQPVEIWGCIHQSNSFNLTNRDTKNPNFQKIFWLSLAILAIPIYYLIRPILLKIENPTFLNYYFPIFLGVFMLLEIYMKTAFTTLFNKIKSNPILTNLSAFELVFMQKNRLQFVIHGVLNNLITSGKIEILRNNRLNLVDENLTENRYENCIIEIMKEFEPMPYPQLTRLAIEKPIFEQLQKSGTQIKDSIRNSKEYLSIIIIPMVILGITLSIGYSRLISGIQENRPIGYLIFTCVIFTIIAHFYLRRIINYLFVYSIPNLYKNELLESKAKQDWEWRYFILGNVLLTSSFVPLTEHVNDKSRFTGNCGSGCGSSGGSSCGSSCGGGCGGCGGGGD